MVAGVLMRLPQVFGRLIVLTEEAVSSRGARGMLGSVGLSPIMNTVSGRKRASISSRRRPRPQAILRARLAGIMAVLDSVVAGAKVYSRLNLPWRAAG
jgi:hypothetical protein